MTNEQIRQRDHDLLIKLVTNNFMYAELLANLGHFAKSDEIRDDVRRVAQEHVLHRVLHPNPK